MSTLRVLERVKDKMTEKKEAVEMEAVTVKLPKAIMDFIRGVGKDPEDYLQYSIIDGFRADIETMDGVWGYEYIYQRLNLGPVFEAFGVSQDPRLDC
jgi:hypothetical protein